MPSSSSSWWTLFSTRRRACCRPCASRRRRGDADTFRRAAHSLKSNGLTFGATEFAARARALELGGIGVVGDGVTLDALDAAWATARAALSELRNAA